MNKFIKRCLLACCLCIITVKTTLAQDILSKKITLSFTNASLDKALQDITAITGLKFAYPDNLLDKAARVSKSFRNEKLSDILNKLLPDNLSYKLIDNTIVLKNAPLKKTQAPQVQTPAINIQGTVTDDQGNLIPGATVRIKNTSQVAITNAQGYFGFNGINSNAVLLAGYLGYTTREIPIEEQTQINIVLTQNNARLNEVVVVGYGTQQKVNLTGSVAVLKGEEIATRQVGQTSAALQGMAPGVTVKQQGGQPGKDGGSLRIRGVGTISGSGNGGADPLILVDGVVADMNNIDPNEIASISILKDASSAAIYGSRAANGVILITTKRAGDKKSGVSYNTYIGWQQPTNKPKIVNAIDHMTLLNEAYTNIGLTPLYPQTTIDEYREKMSTDPDHYPNTDWQKTLFTTNGFMQHHSISVAAAGEKAKMLAILSYQDQEGIIPNTNFKRYNLRINSDARINDRFSTTMDVFLRRTDLSEPAAGTGNIFYWIYRMPATQPARYSNGLYGEGWNGDNPLAKALDGGLSTSQDISAIVNLGLKYKPAQWLTAEIYYSPKYYEPHTKSFVNTIQTYRPDYTPGYKFNPTNSLTEGYSRDWNNNLRALLTFNHQFNGGHELTVLGGYQQEDDNNTYISAFRDSFALPQYQQLSSGSNNIDQKASGTTTEWALRSFFGRINYNYKQRYLLEINGRYDGSSRFAPENHYAFFPSFSAGWRISEEPFLKNRLRFLDNLKLRGSWGRLGNQNINGLYGYSTYIALGATNYIFNGQVSNGAALLDMANRNIQWETTEETDAGMDITLWQKLNITAEYYRRRTTGILLQLNIPGTVGLNSPYQNAGVVANNGWDFSATYNDHIGQLGYAITLNASDVKNKVVDMKGILQTGLTVNRVGYPLYSIYGYEAEGFFQSKDEVNNHAKQFGNVAPGDIKYKDENGDGVVDSKDQKVIGSTIPRYTYSLNLALKWKGFDLSVLGQGVGKANGYLYNQAIFPFYTGGTIQEQHKDRWTPDHTNAKFPRLAFNETNNIQNSTFWMKNAAYLRIKNLQVGYTLPEATLKALKLQKVRVYASGQNLFTFDNFWQGYDVEAPVSDGSWYAQVKTFSIGVDVNF